MGVYAHVSSIYDLVETIALSNADDIALAAPDGRKLTYGAVLQKVRTIGSVLRRLHIEKTDRVAVVLPNSPDMAIAFLGVASFSVCAPLNPKLPAGEYEFYFTDLNAKALLVAEGSPAAATQVGAELGLEIINLDQLDDELIDTSRPAREGPQYTDYGSGLDISLVLHTSGTTSLPKLVPLSHRNLCASAHNVCKSLMLTSEDRCLNVMPLFHIHGLVGVLLATVNIGGSVICCSGFADDTFISCIEKMSPTWYSAVPTIHQAVVKLAGIDKTLPAKSEFRFIRSSSASLPPELMRELEKIFDVPVIEAYGMTEAAHQMASNPLPPAERKMGTVGIQAGPDVAIMSDKGDLLPALSTGELVIRGNNVMAGYVNNPSANANAFTDGWFRTGDQGSIDLDGYIRISGRLKEIINRGGEKISPREIDEVLLTHEYVVQAVAFAVPHDSLGEDLVAAVVTRDGCDLSEQTLREFAFTKLAAHKVPSQIAFVEEIPKGPTGKIQRIGLHEKLAGVLQQAYVAPGSDMEEIVCELWREVLHVRRIGVHDNFFALGGDSLAGVRLVARLDARFELEVGVENIFREPTVAGQSQLIEHLLIDQIIGS